MEKNNGGQAFPHLDLQWDNDDRVYFYDTYSGMTLRQWYKGMALTAAATCGEVKFYPASEELTERIVRIAAEIADALIAEDEEFEAKQ